MPEYPSRVVPVRPIGGIDRSNPADTIDLGASPDIQNMHVVEGMLCKRPGYALFPTGMSALSGAPVEGLYSTHDDQDNTRFYAVTRTTVYRYNSGTKAWDAMAGPALTGGVGQLFSFETSQNTLVFSQGVDQVMALPLTAAVYAILNANCPPAKYLARFADRLYIARTVEGGVTKPYRVRWSVNADHTNWVGVGSGFRDNLEQPYFIRNIKKLQNDLAVYTERSTILAQRTGAASAPAQYIIAVQDVGLYAPGSLQSRNEFHVSLGNDDFYTFSGGAPTAVGGSVRDTVFGSLNPAGLEQSFSALLHDVQEALFFLCTGINTVPDTVWVYNYRRNIWFRWTVSGHTCATLHRRDAGLTIDELVGTIDQQNFSFDSAVLLQAYPTLMTGSTGGFVYNWSTQFSDDAGAAIDAYWTSKDLTTADVAEGFYRHMVTLKSVGVSYHDPGSTFDLQFYWSTDGGDTWQGPDTVSGGSLSHGVMRDLTWFREITDKRIRIKIRNNTTGQDPCLSVLSFDLKVDSQVF